MWKEKYSLPFLSARMKREVMAFILGFFPEEIGNLVERNHICLVVEVCMVGSGNNQRFLVISFQFLERIFAEVA